MHAGSVPVAVAERLAVVFHVDTVFFANAVEEIAGDPHFVGGSFGAFSEDLEFPLAFGHLGVDAFVVDSGIEAEVEVLLDDLAGDVTHEGITHAAVVRALADLGETIGGKAQRTAVLIEEVFLLEAEPCAGIVEDGGATVGRVRGAVRHHDFAHDDGSVLAGAVRENCYWLEHAIGASAGCLPGGRAVEAPKREFLKGGKAGELLDLGFAAKVRDGGVSVEPDVFQFVFGHFVSFCFVVSDGFV